MHEQTEKEDLTMKKRVLAALLCTSLTAGALAGCGSFGAKRQQRAQRPLRLQAQKVLPVQRRPLIRNR